MRAGVPPEYSRSLGARRNEYETLSQGVEASGVAVDHIARPAQRQLKAHKIPKAKRELGKSEGDDAIHERDYA